MMHETEVMNIKVSCWQQSLNPLNLYMIYEVLHCLVLVSQTESLEVKTLTSASRCRAQQSGPTMVL